MRDVACTAAHALASTATVLLTKPSALAATKRGLGTASCQHHCHDTEYRTQINEIMQAACAAQLGPLSTMEYASGMPQPLAVELNIFPSEFKRRKAAQRQTRTMLPVSISS